ncbi:MAG: TMEM43 family protein [Verrucomicrobiota bacterium]|nr:TMEM43 family protein [Verrucomicrobiota bacterium]
MGVVTEVTRQSIFGRIGNSIVGMLFGFVLLAGSVILLFWNEGRAVATAKSLREGAATVIDVPADNINSANESKLIHVTSETAVTEPLHDPIFNVSEKALRLRRNIEVYVWKEKKESKSRDKIGGGKGTSTTYSYEKVWAPDLIKSSSFKNADEHRNPSRLEIPKKEFVATNATLGEFRLTLQIIGKVEGDEGLEATHDRLSHVSEDVQSKLKLDGGKFYLGADPANPEIGDEKISFGVLRPGTLSVVAAQTKQSFAPYMTANEREIELVEPGNHSAAQMFAHAQAAESHAHLDPACGWRGSDVLWRSARSRADLRDGAHPPVSRLTRGTGFRHRILLSLRDRVADRDRGGLDSLSAPPGYRSDRDSCRLHRDVEVASRETRRDRARVILGPPRARLAPDRASRRMTTIIAPREFAESLPGSSQSFTLPICNELVDQNLLDQL